MALFKIFKGKRSALDNQPKVDGHAYYCPDEGSFWIDHTDDSGNLLRTSIKDAEAVKLFSSMGSTYNKANQQIMSSLTIGNMQGIGCYDLLLHGAYGGQILLHDDSISYKPAYESSNPWYSYVFDTSMDAKAENWGDTLGTRKKYILATQEWVKHNAQFNFDQTSLTITNYDDNNNKAQLNLNATSLGFETVDSSISLTAPAYSGTIMALDKANCYQANSLSIRSAEGDKPYIQLNNTTGKIIYRDKTNGDSYGVVELDLGHSYTDNYTRTYKLHSTALESINSNTTFYIPTLNSTNAFVGVNSLGIKSNGSADGGQLQLYSSSSKSGSVLFYGQYGQKLELKPTFNSSVGSASYTLTLPWTTGTVATQEWIRNNATSNFGQTSLSIGSGSGSQAKSITLSPNEINISAANAMGTNITRLATGGANTLAVLNTDGGGGYLNLGASGLITYKKYTASSGSDKINLNFATADTGRNNTLTYSLPNPGTLLSDANFSLLATDDDNRIIGIDDLIIESRDTGGVIRISGDQRNVPNFFDVDSSYVNFHDTGIYFNDMDSPTKFYNMRYQDIYKATLRTRELVTWSELCANADEYIRDHVVIELLPIDEGNYQSVPELVTEYNRILSQTGTKFVTFGEENVLQFDTITIPSYDNSNCYVRQDCVILDPKSDEIMISYIKLTVALGSTEPSSVGANNIYLSDYPYDIAPNELEFYVYRY